MRIGISNAESLLFEDPAPWKTIPDLATYRDQWAFSRTSPHLRPTGLRAVIDFLEAADESHAAALSSYFGADVTIDKFDPNPVKNMEFDVDDPPNLGPMSRYTGFACHRDGGTLKITFWR